MRHTHNVAETNGTKQHTFPNELSNSTEALYCYFHVFKGKKCEM